MTKTNFLGTYRGLAMGTYLAALGHFTLELSHQFLPILFPAWRLSMNLSYAQVGMLGLVSTLGTTVMQPIFGHLSDLWKPRIIIPFSVAWISLLLGLSGFMNSYATLIVVVGLGALGSAGFHPAGASLASKGNKKRLGGAMSVFSVSGNMGSALSPILIAAAVLRWGPQGTGVLIPIGIITAGYLVIRFRQVERSNTKNKTVSDEKAENMGGSKLTLGLIVLAVWTRSWVQGAVMNFMPEWLTGEGYSSEAAGALLSLMLLSLSVGGLLGGPFSDKVGKAKMLGISLLLLGPLVWIYLQSSGVVQIVSVSLAGLMVGSSFPVTILMAQEAWPRGAGLASALAIGIGWLPAGISSWIVGRMADASTLTSALETLVYVPLVGVAAVGVLVAREKE